MASITNSRFTLDSSAGLAAAPLSRHLTSDLANVVETYSFVERRQVHFDVSFTSSSQMELFVQRDCDLQALLERPKQAVEMITRSLRKS